jgi:hypothetical protein
LWPTPPDNTIHISRVRHFFRQIEEYSGMSGYDFIEAESTSPANLSRKKLRRGTRRTSEIGLARCQFP